MCSTIILFFLLISKISSFICRGKQSWTMKRLAFRCVSYSSWLHFCYILLDAFHIFTFLSFWLVSSVSQRKERWQSVLIHMWSIVKKKLILVTEGAPQEVDVIFRTENSSSFSFFEFHTLHPKGYKHIGFTNCSYGPFYYTPESRR